MNHRILAALAGLALLSACGIAGEPVQPSGAVNVGVGSGGVTTSAVVGARKGNVTVAVGL